MNQIFSFFCSTFLVAKHFKMVGGISTVAWRGSLLIFSFLNFFVLGESLVHMETLFKNFEGEKSILEPKITLESLGFEPATSNSVKFT